MREIIKSSGALTQEALIGQLNPVLKGVGTIPLPGRGKTNLQQAGSSDLLANLEVGEAQASEEVFCMDQEEILLFHRWTKLGIRASL